MSKLSFLAKKLFNPDFAALVEADYIDAEAKLTEDGKRALLQELFLANMGAMVARANARIEERKADECKKN